jgi:hypothetical protein
MLGVMLAGFVIVGASQEIAKVAPVDLRCESPGDKFVNDETLRRAEA